LDKFGNKNPNEVTSHMDSKGKDWIGYIPINRKTIWGFAAMSRSALAIFFCPIRLKYANDKIAQSGHYTREGPFFR